MTKNNFPIYLSLATIFGVLIGIFMNGNTNGFSLNSNTKNEAKIRRLMDYIDQNYVDTINTSSLLDEAISDMLDKLDPHSAYIPKENLQVSFGEAEVGKAIVANDLISGVVFTGSKDVGLSIYKQLSGTFTSDRYDFSPRPKLCITEMGGKNAIIVSNNCELDETISGILYSSFAHAGQKCSAASRIIIDKEIKDAFIKRFVEAVKNIKVGEAYKFSTFINPVATTEDKLRIKEIAKEAKEEAKKFGGVVHLDYTEREYPGDCIGPSIFELPAEIALKEVCNSNLTSRDITQT